MEAKKGRRFPGSTALDRNRRSVCPMALRTELFFYYLFVPYHGALLTRPDNIVWALFNLPFLLATVSTQEELDFVGWLDRCQVLLFFTVLSLLVFLPSIHLNADVSLAIQDVALTLCGLLRISGCRTASERRLFTNLTVYFVLYGSLSMLGEFMHSRGLPPGSMIDLVWTVPVACLILLTFRNPAGEKRQDTPERLLFMARHTQGLVVAALAGLSIAVSALLAMHQVFIGGAFVLVAFALFAMRTNAREHAWQGAHAQLERTALYDTLTGLGNRMMLRRYLVESVKHDGSDGGPALVFADLDRFKSINDSLGHTLGDQLLIGVASRLRAAAPPHSVVCRHGGDEFVLLASALNAEQARAIGETLLEALRPAYQISGQWLHCTASIGVVLAEPGESPDELLRTADHAMYRAKQLGKDCVQFFDAAMRNEMRRRWQMEADLRRSLENGGLDVAFQPILTVEGGEISGFEALARWHHPLHGNIPPAEFIPLAEESGLILPLGLQMLEKACRQVVLWNTLWGTELTLSVNVSPRQFADTNLLNTVLAVLERTHLPPSLLQLEITETSLLLNLSQAKETLTAARAFGVRISLDDFGTGYSSLAFLLNLPVDEVKVDRSFVSEMRLDPHRKELVRAVVQLGQSLGKRVVAEGVETEDDLRELTAMGCECVQGWHIGRPMSAEATEAGLPSMPSLQRRSGLQDREGLSLWNADDPHVGSRQYASADAPFGS